jgi:DNA repair protein RecO (recombination protein O)
MEWRDDGIILGLKRHGEGNVIVEAMTRQHGRHLGIVRGGRGSKLAAVLQPGNAVGLVWRARLSDHLGQYAVEPLKLIAGSIIGNGAALQGLSTLSALTRFLPERDPHEGLFEALAVILEHLDQPEIAAPLLVRFELALLAELGFGLDLTTCAVTGAHNDLTHVSPKSGRAVSRRVATPYKDRLLPLPAFLHQNTTTLTAADMRAAAALSAHFIERDVLIPRGLMMPESRRPFLEAAFDLLEKTV